MVIRLSRYTNEIMAQENLDTFHTIFIPFRLSTCTDPKLTISKRSMSTFWFKLSGSSFDSELMTCPNSEIVGWYGQYHTVHEALPVNLGSVTNISSLM